MMLLCAVKVNVIAARFPVDMADKLLLIKLTSICCSLSLFLPLLPTSFPYYASVEMHFGLMKAMFPFQVTNRSFIANNVYVCLVVFQIIFLIGMEHDRRDVFCGINALLFHIIGLAIAAWLCFEGETAALNLFQEISGFK